MRLFPLSLLVFGGLGLLPAALLLWSYFADIPGPAVLISGCVAMVLVAFAAGAVTSRYVVRRLQGILQAMLKIAQGHRGVSVAVHGKGELSELAHALNYMSTEVTAYEDEQRALLARVQQGCVETVRALVSAIHARDPYTRGHANRVSRLSVLVAKELGLGGDALNEVELGGILHDVGKIGIRDHILLKPAQLSTDEMEIMRSHPEHGRRILSGVSFLKPVLPLVYHHHERWDGTGYPARLKGEDIPIGARIIAVVDTYDAIVTDRPYQKGKSFEEARLILDKLRDLQFDGKVLDALYAVMARRKKIKDAPDDDAVLAAGPVLPAPETPHELVTVMPEAVAALPENTALPKTP